MTAANTACFAGSVNMLFSVAVMILVFIFFLKDLYRVPEECTIIECAPVDTSDGRVVSQECSTGALCEIAYYIPELGACLTTAAPINTSCENNCYIDDAESTQCNAFGACVGNATECRGYCQADSACNETIPLNPYWLDEDNFDDGLILWKYVYKCIYDRCELFMLDEYWRADVNDYGAPIGVGLRCLDFLDVAWSTERSGCLFEESFLLDMNMTNGLFVNSTPTTPTQFRMCTFHYACAPFNATAYTKRSLGAGYPDHLQAIVEELLLSP
jgi:hypothetical protein